MKIKFALFAIGLVLPALAIADTITVYTRPGNPAPDRGVAFLELKLIRPVRNGQRSAPVETVFREIEAAVREADIRTEWAMLVPDANSVVIEVEIGENKYRLASCHPFFERNPGLVVTARGVESLGTRSRSDVLINQPLEFQRGRKAFDPLSAITSFVREEAKFFRESLPSA
jgi:hypothetical protein